MTTLDRVIQVIQEYVTYDNEAIDGLGADTTFESLDFDSLDMVEVAMMLEDEFELELTNDQVDGFITLADVAKLVDSLK